MSHSLIATPETSPLFRKIVQPDSGIASYILDKRINDHSKSLYFTTKSLSNNGRFLLFSTSSKDETKPAEFAVADLMLNTITQLNNVGAFYFDPDSCIMISVRNDGFFKRELLVDLHKETKLCDIPEALSQYGKKIHYFCTHLTLTPDKTSAFLDLRIDDHFIQGTVNLTDGSWHFWGEAPFYANHGQLNPVNPNLALVAWELEYSDSTGQKHVIHQVDGFYPRMWLVQPGNRRTMVPPRAANYATHELWTPDGQGFIWCSERAPGGGSKYAFQLATGQEPTTDWTEGVYYQDLASGTQSCICPFPAIHASISRDNQLVTHDYPTARWWRGCAWQVGFFNRRTRKHLYIYPDGVPLTTEDKPSNRHPDPHPNFVCNDQYIVCTVNNPDGCMDVSLTPVQQLLDATQN